MNINENRLDTKPEKPERDLSSKKGHQLKPTAKNFAAQLSTAREHLRESFDTLFRSMGGTYASHGEEAFSGDGASIYVLASLKNAQGKETPELVKVGWGEFSKDTFASNKYPRFTNFPFAIYCVRQGESYLANKKLIKEMREDPKKYLKEHSLFAATQGEVQKSDQINYRNLRLDKDVEAVPYETMLRTVRNQIIKKRTTPEEFAAFLRELPDDPAELGHYISSLEYRFRLLNDKELLSPDEKTAKMLKKYNLLHLLEGMGIETYGIVVSDKKAMASVLALKKQFNFETNAF